jgi:hypothetical protein
MFDDFEDTSSFRGSVEGLKKVSPVKQAAMDRPESAMSDRSRRDLSPSKSSSRTASREQRVYEFSESTRSTSVDERMSPAKRPSSSQREAELRDNEGLTVAIKNMEETYIERHESSSLYRVESFGSDESRNSELAYRENIPRTHDMDYNPDGPDLTSVSIDDTAFSNFSEMPNLDMTKFAFLSKKSPTKEDYLDQVSRNSALHIRCSANSTRPLPAQPGHR